MTPRPTAARLAEIDAWADGAHADGSPRIPKGIPSMTNDLRAEVRALRREVECLRRYGNKDCTAMADAALAEGWEP